MTEAEWIAATDPHFLLRCGGSRVTPRKLCLVAAAFARRLFVFSSSEWVSSAIERLEHIDDNGGFPSEHGAPLASVSDLRAALIEVAFFERHIRQSSPFNVQGTSLLSAVSDVAVLVRLIRSRGRHDRLKMVRSKERRRQRLDIRDVFGNPFRAVEFTAEMRTSTGLALARQMDANRNYSLLPILADALQDAGCEDADMLAHCRDRGPHVKGCWVVDLVLGKS